MRTLIIINPHSAGGRDWSRSLGVPEDPHEAVDWLAHGRPVPCDLGKVEYLNGLTTRS
jgi:diacylglycerol kinase family enzyme